MASTRRRPHTSLERDLFEAPQFYELFQAMALLERMAAREHDETGLPPVDPLGQGSDPSRAALAVRSAVPLGFAAAEVNSVRRPRDGGPIEMIQTIVGLTGPSGVLPHALSELVQVSVRERNLGLRDFLDVFNNRLAGLLYNAWAKYRIVAERQRSLSVGTATPADHALKSLVGLGLPATANRTSAPDALFVYFGGLFGRQSRSAVAVERALAGIFGHQLDIAQFCGEWLPIAVNDRTRLPERASPEGSFARLGDDAVIGGKIFEAQSTVRINIRSLDYPHFRSLLPDGKRAQLFTDVAAHALGADKTFRVRLELKPDQVPGLRLGKDRDDPAASRLGWNTWLSSDRPRRDIPFADIRPTPHLR